MYSLKLSLAYYQYYITLIILVSKSKKNVSLPAKWYALTRNKKGAFLWAYKVSADLSNKIRNSFCHLHFSGKGHAQKDISHDANNFPTCVFFQAIVK